MARQRMKYSMRLMSNCSISQPWQQEIVNRCPNSLAPRELRIGDLRADYEVQESPEPEVQIRAIGVKEGNQARIANKEIDL